MSYALKKLRLKKKMSQAALAAWADLSREYVNKIEAGRYDPPLSTINGLAAARREGVYAPAMTTILVGIARVPSFGGEKEDLS